MRPLVLIYRGEQGPEEVSVQRDGERCALARGERRQTAETVLLPDGRLLLRLQDGRQICGRVLHDRPGLVRVVLGGESHTLALADRLRDRLAHAEKSSAGESAEDEVRALMPGRVIEVLVEPGDEVSPGGLLLVLEAMKMQNEIRSATGGTVVRVEAQGGKPVETGALLAVLKRGP
jgi:biotin carboxyl carrier protein